MSADVRTSSVTFPQGTLLDGLANMAISGSGATIRFPRAGATPTPSPARTTMKDGASLGFSYVNETGRAMMFSEPPWRFPVGTIIVRERLIPPALTPDRLAVMIKREQKFNPKGAGWEFLSVDGDVTKILKREKKGGCVKCHDTGSRYDFVFF